MTFLVAYLTLLASALCLLLAFRRDPDGTCFFDKQDAFTLRGLAIVLVFFNHFTAFQLQTGSPLDPFLNLFPYSGSLAVGLFLFCSGYATYASSDHTLKVSLRWTLRKVLVIYLCFALRYAAELWLLWSRNGNTGGFGGVFLSLAELRLPQAYLWYLEVQVSAYILFSLAFKASKRYGEHLLWSCALVYVAALASLGFSDFWWNSALCFPIGVSIAKHREAVLAVLRKMNVITSALPAFALLGLFYWMRVSGVSWAAAVTSLIACFVVILPASRYRIRSRPLAWVGERPWRYTYGTVCF